MNSGLPVSDVLDDFKVRTKLAWQDSSGVS